MRAIWKKDRALDITLYLQGAEFFMRTNPKTGNPNTSITVQQHRFPDFQGRCGAVDMAPRVLVALEQ